MLKEISERETVRGEMMKYCYIYGDSAEHLYLGRESILNIKLCPHCNMVLNREEVILQAADTVKWRKKKFFVTTYDGVSIASQRFYELYQEYQMRGIEFIPFKKALDYYICRFINTVAFDLERAKQVRVEYEGKITYGVVDNGICPTCKRSKGHHHPWPYRIIESDEQKLQANTFYCSDIEFAENNAQHPLIWATEDIIEVFTQKKCGIFYKNVEGNFGKGDCGK